MDGLIAVGVFFFGSRGYYKSFGRGGVIALFSVGFACISLKVTLAGGPAFAAMVFCGNAAVGAVTGWVVHSLAQRQARDESE